MFPFGPDRESLCLVKAGRYECRISNYGAGRKKGDQPDVLYVCSRLLYCSKHEGQILQVRNTNGIMQCPKCKVDPEPALVSTATGHVVERLLVRRLAGLIRADGTSLIEQALDVVRTIIADASRPNNDQLANLERRSANLTRSIEFILANPGDTDTDVEKNTTALAHQRAERALIAQEIASIKALRITPAVVPTLEDARTVCEDLASRFEKTLANRDREAVAAVRRMERGRHTQGCTSHRPALRVRWCVKGVCDTAAEADDEEAMLAALNVELNGA